MIPIVLFGVLVAVLAALVLYSLHELDNPLVLPQVIAALLAAVLAFTLSMMLINNQVGDTILSLTSMIKYPMAPDHPKWFETTYTYRQTNHYYTDSSISLVLTLIGICESLLVLFVVVSTVLRVVFSPGDRDSDRDGD